MQISKSVILFTFVTLSAFASSIGAAWPYGPEGDLQFETSSFMKTTAYAKPDTLSSDSAPSGAYGPYSKAFEKGLSKEWYIESQRFGADLIDAGLAWKRKDLIDRGLHILDWGFQQQNPDGSFSCPDAFHSTAFFVEAAARTALLLKDSSYKADYASWVEKVKPKLLAAARWMSNPKIAGPGMAGDAIYTHRYYLNADALGFVGVLLQEPSLINDSIKYVHEGISKQDPKGFNPEKGGWDTSYHSVGLVFALRFYSIVADSNFRREMSPMIARALEWLKNRISSNGKVDQTGNTRTGNGQEIGRDKKAKTMSYGSAFRAFDYWSQITANKDFEKVAQSLYEFSKSHAH